MPAHTIETDRCPLCASPSTAAPILNSPYTFQCWRCGEFQIESEVYSELKRQPLAPRQIANLSGHIRENQGIELSVKSLSTLSNLRTPGVGVRAGKLLRAIAREWPTAGDPFFVDYWALRNLQERLASSQPLTDTMRDALRWLAIGWVQDGIELAFVMQDVLELRGLIKAVSGSGHYSITASGWAQLDEWKEKIGGTNHGFVAMRFTSDFAALFEKGLSLGISEAGYIPVRIDRHEHNNRIDDEIIAQIRQARFLVADFTEDRGGIYFEAGYAMGLERPVIWTVRKDALDRVHFDNRQYNFIEWEQGQWDSLVKRLKNRIEATIGRGPYSVA